MEITKKDGTTVRAVEPAFPFVTISQKQNALTGSMEINQTAVTGMSLRDYFADSAMSELVGYEDDDYNFDAVARDSYRMADAMLTARQL